MIKSKKKSLIFDLDGTLIDSSESIINTYREVFDEHNFVPKVELKNDLIGPPLLETLSILSGSNDRGLLEKLSFSFMKIYDEKTFKNTNVYNGILEMLLSLHREDFIMFIATNKRIKPTISIIDHLNWSRYFRGIYGLDSINNNQLKKACKSDLLKFIAQKYNIHETVYIGDRNDDLRAANESSMDFIHVNWGYGEINNANILSFENPIDLFSHLKNNEF